jgi:hypothetical protein
MIKERDKKLKGKPGSKNKKSMSQPLPLPAPRYARGSAIHFRATAVSPAARYFYLVHIKSIACLFSIYRNEIGGVK